jgi:transposase
LPRSSLPSCRAPARRKFFDEHAATKSPLAYEARQRLVAPYAIEVPIRGQPPEAGPAARLAQSAPLCVELLPV